MRIEFETDEMTVNEMVAVRKLMDSLITEASEYEDKYHNTVDTTLEFPGRGGDKK